MVRDTVVEIEQILHVYLDAEKGPDLHELARQILDDIKRNPTWEPGAVLKLANHKRYFDEKRERDLRYHEPLCDEDLEKALEYIRSAARSSRGSSRSAG